MYCRLHFFYPLKFLTPEVLICFVSWLGYHILKISKHNTRSIEWFQKSSSRCTLSLPFSIVHFFSHLISHFLHFKVVSEQAYKNWLVMRREAMSAIEKKEELLMDTAASMENNLTLLGKLKDKNNNSRNNQSFLLTYV